MPQIPILIKLEAHFIREDNIRAVSRHGTGTTVSLIMGEDITVNIEYEKVKAILPKIFQ
ncbi:MAG: hypothetical protein ACE5DN_04465 [Flavobacteriales bacterium]